MLSKIFKMGAYASLIMLCGLQSACFKIYKYDLKQGNCIMQEQVGSLKPNMTKAEVQNIMGTPALKPIINTDRWDYYYRFKTADGKKDETKLLTLYFVQDKLKAYDGDWKLMHLPRKKH